MFIQSSDLSHPHTFELLPEPVKETAMFFTQRMFNVLGMLIVFACLSPNSHGQKSASGVAESASDEPNAEKAVSLEMVRHDIGKTWKKVEMKGERVVYAGDPGDVHYMTLTRSAPDLPELKNVAALQDHFRKKCQKESGGILSVEVTKVQGMDAVVYYSKDVREGIRGYRYIARCVIPLDKAWFEIRMDAIEMTPATGAREAVVRVFMGSDVEYEDVPPDAAPSPGPKLGKPTRRVKGWFKDPYDPKYDSSAMCSVADDAKYDAEFPQHPLSRLRTKFPSVLEKLHVEKSLGSL